MGARSLQGAETLAQCQWGATERFLGHDPSGLPLRQCVVLGKSVHFTGTQCPPSAKGG